MPSLKGINRLLLHGMHCASLSPWHVRAKSITSIQSSKRRERCSKSSVYLLHHLQEALETCLYRRMSSDTVGISLQQPKELLIKIAGAAAAVQVALMPNAGDHLVPLCLSLTEVWDHTCRLYRQQLWERHSNLVMFLQFCYFHEWK